MSWFRFCLFFGVSALMFERGRVDISTDDTASSCSVVSFHPTMFDKEKPVHVQITANYVNAQSGHVHDAVVSWIEKLNDASFHACVMVVGRETNHRVTVDWLVFQGKPSGVFAGRIQVVEEWWTGTTCKKVELPRVSMHHP